MSREIDERVVAMYFEDRNFESGAQKAIQTLDQLKQSMNMKNVGKGLESLEEIGKKFDLEKINKSANKVKETISGVGNVIKKAFSIGPIDNLYHALDNFKNKYFDRVLGFDIADKLVNNLENIVRSLTIAPVSAGWQQYENTMDSVKTIMSSTGEDIDTVKRKLAEMTDYANLTIYSLNDMTSNLGKFTNNGVKLEDATNAMIGLANATADAGQGSQQASMAMYNVSQAIGVGKMTTIDWKSLENANIATVKLKQTFMDAAVAGGQLEKKIAKDAKSGKETVEYWTKASAGQKAVQVTTENFRETLNKGWLDKEAMMKTFSIYSGQLTALQIQQYGFSIEESRRLEAIGKEAMKAATEVRTFSKMMDALKESVQSGWATSFQYIFGDMEEGTSLWTALNDKIDSLLSAGTEERNNILMAWRGLMEDENKDILKIKDVYEYRKSALTNDYNKGYITEEQYIQKMKELEETLGDPALWVDYRDIAIETFMDLFDTIQMVVGAVGDAFSEVFGKFDANTIKRITQGVHDFVESIKEWLGETTDANSRISKLRTGLTGIFRILKIGVNLVKTLFGVAVRVIKPFIDPLLNLFEKFGKFMNFGDAKNLGEMLTNLGDKFKNLWEKLTQLGWSGAFAKIGEWISGLWTTIKSSVKDWLVENGLEGVVEWFSGIKAKIEEGIETVRGWWEGSGIPDFFTGLWETIASWFNPDEETGETPIGAFFTRIWEGIDGAYQELKRLWAGSGIPAFFAQLWEDVTGLFKPKIVGYDTGLTGKEAVYEDAPIVAFFKGIWKGIQDAYEGIQKWWNESKVVDFFKRIWEEVTSLFKPKKVGYDTGLTGKEAVYEDAPIVQFFNKIKEGLEAAWTGITAFFERIGVTQFFSNVWDWLVSQFQAKTLDDGTVEDAPIVAFFRGIGTALEEAWGAITGFFQSDTVQGIGKFFTDAWGWLMDQLGLSGEQEVDTEVKVSGKFNPSLLSASLNGGTSLSSEQKALLKAMTEEAMGITSEDEKKQQFTDEDIRSKVPIVDFLYRVKEVIESAFTTLKTWWESESGIPEFFKQLWDDVTGWFKPQVIGYDLGLSGKEPVYGDSPIVEFFNNLRGKIEEAWKNLTSWEGWAAIAAFFEQLWNDVSSWFKPVIVGYEAGVNGKEAIYDDAPIVKFFNNLKEKVEEAWKNLTDWEGWAAIGEFFKKLWDDVTGWFKPQVVGYDTGLTGKEAIYADAPIVKFFKDLKDDIESAWKGITGWDGWEKIGKLFSDVWGWLIDVLGLNGKNDKEEVKAEDLEVVQSKTGIITTIVEIVSNFFNNAGTWIDSLGGGNIGTRFVNAITKLIESFALILEHVINLVHILVTTFTGTGDYGWEQKLAAIGEFIALIAEVLIAKFFFVKTTSALSKISTNTDTFGTTFLKIAGGLALISLGLSLIGGMNIADLGKAVAVMVVLGGAIVVILALVNNMKENAMSRAEETSGERIAKYAIKSVTLAGVIAESLALLPGIIEKIGSLQNGIKGEDILKTFEGLAILIGAIAISVTVLTKFGGGNGAVTAAAKGSLAIVVAIGVLLIGLDAILGALLGFENAIGKPEYQLAHIQNIEAGGKKLEAIGEAIGRFIGAIVGAIQGNITKYNLIGIGEGSAEAVEATKDVALEDMQHLADLTAVVVEIQDNIPKWDDLWDKWLNEDRMGKLGDNIGRLGVGLGEMVKAVHIDEGVNEQDIAAIRAYTDLMFSFAQVVNILYDAVNQAAVFADGTTVSNLENVGNIINQITPYYRRAAQNLSEAIQEGLGMGEEGTSLGEFTFNATPIITAICRSLENQGKTDIANAVKAMIQFGLDQYSAPSSLGENAIHSTTEIDQALSNLLSIMQTSTPEGGLFGGDLSSFLSPLLGNLGNESQLNTLFSQYGDSFAIFGNGLSDKINDNVHLDVGKWFDDVNKDGMPDAFADIQKQWDEALAAAETSDGLDLQLKIRPVFDLDNFGNEMQTLRTFINSDVPLAMNATIDLGENKKLSIDDSAILTEMRLIKNIIENGRYAIEGAINNASSNIGSSISNLEGAITNMKVSLDRDTLVGEIVESVDEHLSNAGNNAALTGVTLYGKPETYTPW